VVEKKINDTTNVLKMPLGDKRITRYSFVTIKYSVRNPPQRKPRGLDAKLPRLIMRLATYGWALFKLMQMCIE
jgi:hypothetical protein